MIELLYLAVPPLFLVPVFPNSVRNLTVQKIAETIAGMGQTYSQAIPAGGQVHEEDTARPDRQGLY